METHLKKRFIQFTERHEGLLNYLYLDVIGRVTTGGGNLVDSVSDAQRLPFYREDGTRASPQEIETAWMSVKARTDLSGGPAFESLTTIRLTAGDVLKLVNDRIRSNEKELSGHFKDWETFPDEVKFALMSMAWAMGTNFVLKPVWAPFVDAVNAGDWKTAAVRSKMSEKGQTASFIDRNRVDKESFEEAARQVQRTEPAEALQKSRAEKSTPAGSRDSSGLGGPKERRGDESLRDVSPGVPAGDALGAPPSGFQRNVDGPPRWGPYVAPSIVSPRDAGNEFGPGDFGGLRLPLGWATPDAGPSEGSVGRQKVRTNDDNAYPGPYAPGMEPGWSVRLGPSQSLDARPEKNYSFPDFIPDIDGGAIRPAPERSDDGGSAPVHFGPIDLRQPYDPRYSTPPDGGSQLGPDIFRGEDTRFAQSDTGKASAPERDPNEDEAAQISAGGTTDSGTDTGAVDIEMILVQAEEDDDRGLWGFPRIDSAEPSAPTAPPEAVGIPAWLEGTTGGPVEVPSTWLGRGDSEEGPEGAAPHGNNPWWTAGSFPGDASGADSGRGAILAVGPFSPGYAGPDPFDFTATSKTREARALSAALDHLLAVIYGDLYRPTYTQFGGRPGDASGLGGLHGTETVGVFEPSPPRAVGGGRGGGGGGSGGGGGGGGGGGDAGSHGPNTGVKGPVKHY